MIYELALLGLGTGIILASSFGFIGYVLHLTMGFLNSILRR